MKTTKPAMPKVPLGPVLRRYFYEYLVSQRDLSPQTIGSYRDTFRLLLAFIERRYRIKPDVVCVDDLDSPRVLAFLDDLERRRNNTARTRNARRAAIRSFLRYAAGVNPVLLPVAQRVLAIPAKRFERATVGYLTREQIQAIIDSPNTAAFSGQRDRILLVLLYNTGAGVGTCRFADSGRVAGVADVRSHSRQRSQESFGAALATNRQVIANLAPTTQRYA